MTRTRKKSQDAASEKEQTTSSSTRSDRKRADSSSSARKDGAPTTPQGVRISPVARHTRSATKQQDAKQDEKEKVTAELVVNATVAKQQVEETEDEGSPDPKRKRTSDKGHAITDAKSKDKKKGKKKKSKSKKKKKESAKKQQVTPDEGTTVAPPPVKLAPSMDVSVHRLRHLNYQPKPILCLATTPFDSQAADYIALSRENGSVELKSPDEKWRSVATIAGMSSRTVDAMVWTCGVCSSEREEIVDASQSFTSTFHRTHTRTHARRTCVGASRDGTIFVLDFAHGNLSAVTGSGGGGVFSLVSLCGKQCCVNVDCPQLVAAGCQDGSIRIYRLTKDSQNKAKLDLVSTVPCGGTAILSLAWLRTEMNSHGMGGTALFAGVADGTIRRLDCVSTLTNARLTGTSAHAISTGTVVSHENQNWKSTLRMTVESYGRTTPTRVWALKALADGTIVSGDSLGHVQLWDGFTGTLLQSFDQNDNKADVLSLAVSANECRVFASGVDSRVICVERSVTIPPASSGPPKWVMTHAQRPHTHDVKAMAMCHRRDYSGCFGEGNPNEILCSGGVDTKLCTYAIQEFGKSRPRSIYPWPCVSPISLANEARVLAMRREDRVDLYKLAPPATVTSTPVLVKDDETLIGTIGIKGRHNFICSDITNNGRFLVLSNSTGLTLFRLDYAEEKHGGTSLEPFRIELDRSVRMPCLAVKFATNTRLACVDFNGNIHVMKIDDEPERLVLQHTFPESTSNFAIQSLHTSPDGAWLATKRSGAESGTVQLYSIVENDYKHWWSLPALESPISAARFIEGEKPLLIVSCSNCAVYVFDVQARSLSNWSEKLGVPMQEKLPDELGHRADFPVRVASNPATPNMFLLGFFGAFSAIDMNKALPTHSRLFPETHVRGKKRKRHQLKDNKDVDVDNGNCTICLRYNSMLYMDFISKNEMLVVEQPWLNVVASFPAALERKVYGT